jgi:hypothetical protein
MQVTDGCRGGIGYLDAAVVAKVAESEGLVEVLDRGRDTSGHGDHMGLKLARMRAKAG